MRKMRAIRIAKGGYIASSAALCLAGIFLLVHPDVSVLVFCRGLGILLVICGVFKMIGYLARDLYRLAFQFDLAFGIFMLVIGLIMVLKSSIVIRFANFALGIVVLTDGLFKMQMSVDARRFGLRQWWVIAAAAVLTSVFGLLIVLDPIRNTGVISVAVLLGIALVMEGTLNLCVAIWTVKIAEQRGMQASFQKGRPGGEDYD